MPTPLEQATALEAQALSMLNNTRLLRAALAPVTPPPPPPVGAIQTIAYAPDLSAVGNPGQGMEESFEGPPGALNMTGYTWRVARVYWWCDNVDADLTPEALAGADRDLAHAVAMGVLVNLKVAYVGGNEPMIPFARVLRHIRQLAPIITKYAHVIRQWEDGFLGRWGELHSINSPGYTDPDTFSSADRPQLAEMVNLQMELTPPSLYIALRYPTMLRGLIDHGRISPERQKRLALYNDFFLGGEPGAPYGKPFFIPHEGGTFNTAWADGLGGGEREWVHQFGLTHPVRGEADIDYDNEWTAEWALQGDNAIVHGFERQHIDCMREWGAIEIVLDRKAITQQVMRRMGFRLVATQGRYPTRVVPGQPFRLELDLRNEGFSPPRRNYQPVVLFGSSAAVATPSAPMTAWVPGTRTVALTGTVPALPAGSHALALELRDPNAALASRVPFKARLANANTWIAATGRNDLRASVTV